jgi:hypothetical protein
VLPFFNCIVPVRPPEADGTQSGDSRSDGCPVVGHWLLRFLLAPVRTQGADRIEILFPPPGAHLTISGRLSEWLLNSGAYMHWISATPVWYSPRSCTRVEYSKT